MRPREASLQLVELSGSESRAVSLLFDRLAIGGLSVLLIGGHCIERGALQQSRRGLSLSTANFDVICSSGDIKYIQLERPLTVVIRKFIFYETQLM